MNLLRERFPARKAPPEKLAKLALRARAAHRAEPEARPRVAMSRPVTGHVKAPVPGRVHALEWLAAAAAILIVGALVFAPGKRSAPPVPHSGPVADGTEAARSFGDEGAVELKQVPPEPIVPPPLEPKPDPRPLSAWPADMEKALTAADVSLAEGLPEEKSAALQEQINTDLPSRLGPPQRDPDVLLRQELLFISEPDSLAQTSVEAHHPAESKLLFSGRIGSRRRLMVIRHSGSIASEAAVDLGLDWLARHQAANGQWEIAKYGGKQADVGVSGLALLAFLGAGHTEKVGKYKENVRRAVQWLLSIQRPDGCIYMEGETRGIGYHHGIAGLALCEAEALAHVAETRAAAQRAVDYSTKVHQQTKDLGNGRAWRYAPNSSSASIIVTGWYVMQLKAAKEAGLVVNPHGFEGAIAFLDAVENTDSGPRLYGYTSRENVGVRRTAVGVACRQFLGFKREDVSASVQWVVVNEGLPEWGEKADLVGWYWTTQCAFQEGGDLWKRWFASLSKTLCGKQHKAGDEQGSWDPAGAYSEYWGRVGQTAKAVLCLEAPYRYAPLYRDP